MSGLQTSLAVGMFVTRVKSEGRNGKTYESVLLRESIRKGSKVASRTLVVLTKLPKWLIETIENAVQRHSQGRYAAFR